LSSGREAASGAFLFEDDYADCFVGDTLVHTEDGKKPIASIIPGERVWTRFGLYPVKQAWLARKHAPIVRATFSDGSFVTCTENHRFYTDRGFVPLNALRYNDKLYPWISSSSKEESTPSFQLGTIGHVKDFCTGIFGAKLMAQFRQAIKFITEILIPRTMNRITWNAYRVALMPNFMLNSEFQISPIYSESVNWRASGILPKPEKNGTESMLKRSVLVIFKSSAFVSNARLLLWVSRIAVSVATTAKRNGAVPREWTTWIKSVLNAARCTLSTVTTKPRRAPENAVRLCELQAAGFADVYDLEIDGPHEFYANGLLVHNCVRYLYKSMLEAQWQAPRAVRAAEVFHSIPGEDADAITARAMAMRQFNVKNPVNRRGIPPRWRNG
jgi:hypothetical protein